MDNAKSESEDLAVYWVQAQPQVLSFIASFVSDASEANAILQNVALETTRRFAEYDRRRPFVAWAIGIARNEIKDYQQEKGKPPARLDIPIEETSAKTCKSEATRVRDIEKDTQR